MAQRVNGIDDLEEMRAQAASQGASVPNYNEWNNILNDLEEAGVNSTGSYDGDKALHKEIQRTSQEYIDQMQVEQQKQQQQTQVEQPKKNSESDNEQALKATVANGTSSTITADLMKIYHML